jgi:hypothetical protein
MNRIKSDHYIKIRKMIGPDLVVKSFTLMVSYLLHTTTNQWHLISSVSVNTL